MLQINQQSGQIYSEKWSICMSSQEETTRPSSNGRNAYIFLNSQELQKNQSDTNINRNYLTVKPARTRSCSPALLLCEKETELQSTHEIMQKQCLDITQINGNKNTQITTTTVPKNKEINIQQKTEKCITSEKLSIDNTNKSKGAIPKVQSGILRYININKRNLSPEKQVPTMKKQKVVEGSTNNNSNRFAILSEGNNDKVVDVNENKKSFKPPPIFLREHSSNNLVKKIIDTVGKNNFHIVPIRKGHIHETKIVIYNEVDYRKISKLLEESNKNFYAYQLKSSKGLSVVFKGIEHTVDTKEIKEALEELGYKTKSVVNIFNKNKIPQPMFKVELEPDTRKLKGNETHPIYSLRYLLNRRIHVEEPLKRNGPVQCGNCQEFGHTKNYCTLPVVCVACGDQHGSNECTAAKEGLSRKCGNRGGDHTANYRGCPVYKDLLKRLNERKQQARGEIVEFRNTEVATSTRPTSVTVSGIGGKIQQQNQEIPLQSGAISYANIVKTGTQQASAPQNFGGLEGIMYTLTQNMNAFNQNITSIMSSMQNTLQELVRTQNQMLQILLAKK